jgi:GH24 family phage-related lysozyme (muramidase)
MDPRLIQDVALAEAPGGVPVLLAYADGGGVPTVGFGHTGPGVVVGQLYSSPQCEEWLAEDLGNAADQAESLPEWLKLDTPCRQNAVIECVFNLGVGHWTAKFPATRAAIQQQDWQSAHDNLLASPTWIKQVGLMRVQRLANYLLWGNYPS